MSEMTGFAVFMVIVAMVGAHWGFRLSDANKDDAAVSYGLVATLWCLVCMSIAAAAVL